MPSSSCRPTGASRSASSSWITRRSRSASPRSPRSHARWAGPSRRKGQPFRFAGGGARSEEHTSELQSHLNLVCRLLLEKKKKKKNKKHTQTTLYHNIQKLTHRQTENHP